MCDVFSVRGKKLEPERACTLLCVQCALVVKGQSILSRMMNLVLLCSELKFLELWLNQKGLALVVRALAVKGQSILLRT